MTRSFKPCGRDDFNTASPTWTVALFLGLGCVGCDTGPVPKQAANAPSVLQGQRLLSQYQCGSCHTIPDVAAARGGQGPSLAAFGKRSYIAGHIPNTPEALARWIVAPAALVPGTLMPSMGVSPAEAHDMAAYLGALQ